MKKIIKFNDGEIDVSFQKDVTVHADPKSNKTWLEIPGLPADYKDSKKIRVTPPTLTNSKYYFIAADDHKGNSVLAMVQGELNDKVLSQAKEITDKQYIGLAQSFLDEMKGEQHHE